MSRTRIPLSRQDENARLMKERLEMSTAEIGLSVRTTNCLEERGIFTVRDLLSHRSGLARGELIWYGSDNDRDEILRRVRYLPPSWSFRSQFGYQNICLRAPNARPRGKVVP